MLAAYGRGENNEGGIVPRFGSATNVAGDSQLRSSAARTADAGELAHGGERTVDPGWRLDRHRGCPGTYVTSRLWSALAPASDLGRRHRRCRDAREQPRAE